jgi:hypothetical protein
MSAPFAGESPSDYRARRKAEMAGTQATPEAGFEAQKAKVAAQQQRVSRKPAPNAINIDTAAEDEEAVSATHKKLAGGVKALDADAVKAADKDKDWSKMTPEAQQAAARGSSAKTAGASHTTSTPGAAPKTSMASAMEKAGVSNPAPAVKAASREPAKTDPAVAARNNMGAPRTQDNGASSVAGRTAGGSQAERDQARAAATRGSRNSGKAAEAKAAARSASPRSAASAAPTATPVMGRQFPQKETGLYSSRRHAEGFAAMVTPEGGPSSKLSDKPSAQPPVRMADSAGHQAAKTAVDHPTPSAAANPSPVAPTPAGGRFPASPEAQAAAPMNHGSVGIAKPKVGEVTRAIDNPKAPASKMRAGYASHLAEGGNNDTYWAGRDAAKAKRNGAKTAKSAPEVVTETPSLSPQPAPVAKASPATLPPMPPPSAAPAPRPTVGSAPAPAAAPPMRLAPEPQRTPMSSQMNKVTETEPAPSVPAKVGGGSPAPTATPSAPTLGNRPSAPAAGPAGPSAPDRGAVATPPAPTGGGRSGAAPRSPEVGGGRSGMNTSDHSVGIGGHNYGSVVINHNTNNVNYGHVGGSQGNVDHAGGRGYARPSGGPGGGGQPEPEDHQSSGGAKFNAWYHDSTGHHDLQKGIKHITGQTGGSGETLSHGSGNVGANRQTGGTIGGAGGTQRPLKGSARAAGGNQAAQQNTTDTGTTANWQGPATTHQASASGNGTSQFNATP